MRGAAAATSTYMSRNIPMSIVMSIPMTGNAPADMSTATNTDIPTSTPTTGIAPAAADMNTATNMDIPMNILTSTPMTDSAPAAADMNTATNTDIPTSTPTAMDTTMPQAPPVRSM